MSPSSYDRVTDSELTKLILSFIEHDVDEDILPALCLLEVLCAIGVFNAAVLLGTYSDIQKIHGRNRDENI